MPFGFPGGAISEGSKRLELGAVVVVPDRNELTEIDEAQPHAPAASESPRPHYSSRTPILGNDVMRSWMVRFRKLGMQSLWLTSSPREESVAGSALAGLARQGVERLLVIKLKSYSELDLADLVRFHHDGRNPVTEAQDAGGQLGISLLDLRALHAAGKRYAFSCGPAESGRVPYQFHGYAKGILTTRGRQQLVGDALTGACAMQPSGTEIREQVWIGEDVKLADSARVIGPSYVGTRTIVRAGATIGPFASVEHDCVVDCGTTVERSTVLPHTYLAPGLMIRHQLVDGGYLEDMSSGAVADLHPAGLGSRILHRRESRRKVFSETDVFSRASSASALEYARSSTASQPWLEVKL
jgi:carbonic anhydrase/acetyltransferase-like protein (isoleucine patch superfamily)